MNENILHITNLLAEVAYLGIELRPYGDKLRYRPLSAMTPELAVRLKSQKTQLIAILATKTREKTEPRIQAAHLIWQTRQAGKFEYARALFEAWRERVAICEIDGGLSTRESERNALKQIKNMLD